MQRSYHPNGQIKKETWNKGGEYIYTYRREDGPAYQSWYASGQRKKVKYYNSDRVLHNLNGPAFIKWHYNPNFTLEFKPWEDELCTPKKISYYINGKLHCEDGPALIHYNRIDKASYQIEYYINGKLHREDGPAIEICKNNVIVTLQYYQKNKAYREDGNPTDEEWYENGQKKFERYYMGYKLHNENGPAEQIWDEEGNLTNMSYKIHGMFRVSDKVPCEQNWEKGLLKLTSWYLGEHHYKVNHYKKGILTDTVYRLRFKKHREDGPALTYFFPNGKVKSEEFYIDDKLHNENGPAVQEWDEDGYLQQSVYYLNGKKQASLIKRAR